MIVSLNPINRQNRAPIITLDHGLKIKGSIKLKGSVYRGFLFLYEKNSKQFIAQTSTNPNGEFEFSSLSKNFEYFVIAQVIDNNYNLSIFNNLIPK